MAKVYLKGNITHEINQDDAVVLKEQWKDGKKGIADFGSISFNMTEIKSIVLEVENKQEEYSNEEIKSFEQKLNGRSFKQYCYDMGFEIEPGKDARYPKGAVVRDKTTEYLKAKEFNEELEKLKERRYYMETKEHKETLSSEGLEVCQEKSMEKDRCVYCWPWTFAEWCLANGYAHLAEKTNKLYEQFAMPKVENKDEALKSSRTNAISQDDKLHNFGTKDSTVGNFEGLRAIERLCPKCKELTEECICINLADIPF